MNVSPRSTFCLNASKSLSLSLLVLSHARFNRSASSFRVDRLSQQESRQNSTTFQRESAFQDTRASHFLIRVQLAGAPNFRHAGRAAGFSAWRFLARDTSFPSHLSQLIDRRPPACDYERFDRHRIRARGDLRRWPSLTRWINFQRSLEPDRRVFLGKLGEKRGGRDRWNFNQLTGDPRVEKETETPSLEIYPVILVRFVSISYLDCIK